MVHCDTCSHFYLEGDEEPCYTCLEEGMIYWEPRVGYIVKEPEIPDNIELGED